MENSLFPTNKILKADAAGIKGWYNFTKVSTIIHISYTNIYIYIYYAYHLYSMKIFSVNNDKKKINR